MLGEVEASIRFQDAADLVEHRFGIGHAAQRPDNDDVIDARVFQRHRLGQTFDQIDVRLGAAPG